MLERLKEVKKSKRENKMNICAEKHDKMWKLKPDGERNRLKIQISRVVREKQEDGQMSND